MTRSMTALGFVLAAIGYPMAANLVHVRWDGVNGGALAAPTAERTYGVADLDAADVARVSRSLRLEPCDHGRTSLRRTFDGASAAVGNPSIGCTLWARAETPEIIVFAGAVEVAEAKLPVVVYFSSRHLRSGSTDSLVIDVVGGPGGDISPGLNDGIPLALARSGVVVAKIGYTGTRHGTIFPRPNLDIATEQVLGFAKSVRAENPGRKLVLLGESLGALIVARAAASTNRLAIDGLALVAPLLFTPDEAMSNFARIRRPGQSPGVGGLTVRTIESARAPWTSGRLVTVPSEALFSRFFPAESRGRDLGAYLRQAGNVKTLMAFGDNDKIIGLSKLGDASLNAPNIRQLRLREVPHMMNSHSATQVSDEMLDYLL
jgi:pimeloyl-ACP methyl ester carboxylesterase